MNDRLKSIPWVSTLILLLLLTAPKFAQAGYDVGEIAIIEDVTGLILPAEGMCDNMLFGQGLCINHAANAFYLDHGDNFDILMLFTTKALNFLFDVQMGFPVQMPQEGDYLIFSSALFQRPDDVKNPRLRKRRWGAF